MSRETELVRPETVYQKINAVQADLAKQGISKDETNTFDKYKFRGIDAIYNHLSPLLAKHGLVILPRVVTKECIERVSGQGKALFYVTLMIEYDFVSADDGSKHTVVAVGEAMDRGDKATNKAMSAAYKYTCFQAFCIPTDAPDADSETHEASAFISQLQVADMKALIKEVGANEEQFQNYLRTRFKVSNGDYSRIAVPIYKDVIAALERKRS